MTDLSPTEVQQFTEEEWTSSPGHAARRASMLRSKLVATARNPQTGDAAYLYEQLSPDGKLGLLWINNPWTVLLFPTHEQAVLIYKYKTVGWDHIIYGDTP